jgi:hypothetical protein
MSLELFPSPRAINIDGIAHLDVTILFGSRRLGILGHWDIIASSSSGRLGVLVVGHCRIIDDFGGRSFALEEGLFVFSIFSIW